MAMTPSNPFSTRFVRPGAMAFRFPQGQSAATLVESLAAAGWRGQIVGPHGSGKSTLVAALVAALAAASRPAAVFALHDRQRRLPRGWQRQAARAAARLVIVDGYEQLGWLGRRALNRACRRHGWGLLVTAHRDAGFPTLASTSTSLALAEQITEHLLPPGQSAIDRPCVARAFAASRGNLREMLFALYDRYEDQARR